jgi:hypothetical protein
MAIPMKILLGGSLEERWEISIEFSFKLAQWKESFFPVWKAKQAA